MQLAKCKMQNEIAVSNRSSLLANWTVMFSDLHEKHIPEICSNGSNFTADFCEVGLLGLGCQY